MMPRPNPAGGRNERSYAITMAFQIAALSAAPFAPLFALSDVAFAAQGGVRQIANRPGGFPCRVSLRETEPGDTVLLVNHEHQPIHSPFRSMHAIYVRQGSVQAYLGRNEIPEMLRTRPLSVRAFEDAAMLVDADVV
jgi:hypothetical protein